MELCTRQIRANLVTIFCVQWKHAYLRCLLNHLPTAPLTLGQLIDVPFINCSFFSVHRGTEVMAPPGALTDTPMWPSALYFGIWTHMYTWTYIRTHTHSVYLHWSSGRPCVICTALLFHHWIFSSHHVGWNKCTNSCRYKTIMYHHSYHHHSNQRLQYHSYQH